MVKVEVLSFVVADDDRGLLAALQYPDELPFLPVRIFTVTESPTGTERGGHAHRTCHQVLIAIAGSVEVEYDDETGKRSLVLDNTRTGLHIPPLAWAKQTYLSPSAALVVLASHAYDVDDYIDDRTEAARLRSETSATVTRPVN